MYGDLYSSIYLRSVCVAARGMDSLRCARMRLTSAECRPLLKERAWLRTRDVQRMPSALLAVLRCARLVFGRQSVEQWKSIPFWQLVAPQINAAPHGWPAKQDRCA
ncbi:unnamed protein product [Ostreobium quekettii]|uniref:Uncharacterized protein n=1 Tax=Ostreobium quekettii TaxID=121088 RepID=A0A8S1JAX9_9CHLO|nr:unnamed protein product [Ostreobium quekettii]